MKARRHCNELGVCQGSSPDGSACQCSNPFAFAPGTIQGNTHRSQRFWQKAKDIACYVVIVAAAFALSMSFVLLGCQHVKGWPL